MDNQLTKLGHLRMAAEKSRELSTQVAAAAAEAIEEVAGSAVTMEQVDAAINAAIAGAIQEAY